MASAAASESILFIGSILAAAGLAAALGGVTSDLAGALRERSDGLEASLASRIAIVNDPQHVAVSPLTLYVKNVGTRTLGLEQWVVLVDGVASSSWTATVDGAAAQVVRPGELATIVVNDITPAAGDHVATVVPGSGVSARLAFKVGP